MILPLEDAVLLDGNIVQDDLDAFEVAIRKLTNNNFQNKHIRFMNIEIIDSETVGVSEKVLGLRIGDTVEINYSLYNDGLYTIEAIEGSKIALRGKELTVETVANSMMTKVEYPADIRFGIKKLIEYDKSMSGKIGIKSESISRWSTTYYDVNSTENTEGYPSSLLSFLSKYEKMRW